MAAASEPACGSVRQNAPRISPLASRVRYFFFCASVPKFSSGIVTAEFVTPSATASAASTRATSSIISAYAIVSIAAPPHSSGTIIPQQPISASLASSAVANFSSRSRWRTVGRTSASMNWRTVSRMSFWWSLSEKSIASSLHATLMPSNYFAQGETFRQPSAVSPVGPFTQPLTTRPLQQGRTHEFHQEPRQIRRLAVCAHVNRGLLRHGLCPQQADRPRKRSGDGQQHRGQRDALSPRHRGRTHRHDRFYLRGRGFVRSAQGGQPAARLAYGDIDCGLDPDSVSE